MGLYEKITSPLLTGPSTQQNISLGTTATLLTPPSVVAGGAVQVKIANASSTATVAYVVVAKGASAPTFNATPGDTACGSLLFTLDKEWFAFNPLQADVYVIASAVGTPTNIVFFRCEV